MISVERVRALVGENFDAVIDTQGLESVFLQSRGPAALAAISEAEQHQYCAWGIPNTDGFITILIAVLSNDARDAFLVELRSSDFTETEQHGAAVFTWYPQGGIIGPGVSWYAFDGNLWVAAQTQSLEGIVAVDILDAVRQANPDHF